MAGVCYLETHDTGRFAGHFRLRLIAFTPTRLAFEIDGPEDRTVEVIYKLSTQRFREVQRIVHIIFGLEFEGGGSASDPPLDSTRVALPGKAIDRPKAAHRSFPTRAPRRTASAGRNGRWRRTAPAAASPNIALQ